jgi:hypothetical protein
MPSPARLRIYKEKKGSEPMQDAQRKRMIALAMAAMLISGVTHLTAMRRTESRDIHAFITPLKDLETTVRVTKMEPKELEKIGGDFATNYAVFRSLRKMSLLYKSPDKLLLEGKSNLLGEAALLINGPNRFFTLPKLGQRKRENLEKNPVRRQSLLEYGGLLSEGTLGFMRAKFLREETLDGIPTLVYDLNYQGVSGGSYYRLWIDPKIRLVRKRAWFDGDNQLRATFRYEEPREVGGVTLPGRCDIINSDGVTAGSMTYTDSKVNQGFSDKLFDMAP